MRRIKLLVVLFSLPLLAGIDIAERVGDGCWRLKKAGQQHLFDKV